jgi:cell wall-associated NlpC family hydrolase
MMTRITKFPHLKKLNSLGFSHIIIPLIAIVIIGGIGSYLLGVDHADPLSTASLTAAQCQANGYVYSEGKCLSPSVLPNPGGGSSNIGKAVYAAAATRAGKATYVIDTPCPGNTYVTCAKGNASPSSFDCSGLVAWAILRATSGGISLPHHAATMWQDRASYVKSGIASVVSSEKSLQQGDIVFFVGVESDASKTAPGHVGIYYGTNSKGQQEVLDAYTDGITKSQQVNLHTFSKEVGGYVGALRFSY